jgi:hypothetical protein
MARGPLESLPASNFNPLKRTNSERRAQSLCLRPWPPGSAAEDRQVERVGKAGSRSIIRFCHDEHVAPGPRDPLHFHEGFNRAADPEEKEMAEDYVKASRTIGHAKAICADQMGVRMLPALAESGDIQIKSME